MKSQKTSFKSFKELKIAIESNSISFNDYNQKKPDNAKEDISPEYEKELFKKAMEGVKPISGRERIERIPKAKPPNVYNNKDDFDALERLRDLVKYGRGFNVSDTPEYIEGTGYNIHPEIAKRLHRGDFSIQAHIDLHGLRVEDAKEVFEEFLKRAIMSGKKGVMIVHGRGLSSPSEPILKNKVREWLTRGRWRKWVVAYCSARKCDGGAGATYVLLRGRPISRRSKLERDKRSKIFGRRVNF